MACLCVFCGEDGLLLTEVVTVDMLFFMTFSFTKDPAFCFPEVPRCWISVVSSVVFISNKADLTKNKQLFIYCCRMNVVTTVRYICN